MNQFQLKKLKLFFKTNQMPNREEIEKLSNDLGVSVIKLNNWFLKKRTEIKKDF